MRRFVTFGPAFVVLLAAVVTLVAAPAAVRRISYANTDATIRLAQHELESGNILEEINKSVRNIAKSVEPSVVHIAVEGQGQRGWMRISQGSGWVFDDKGDIVTNAHVVRGAPSIVVQFHDGRTVNADLVGTDLTTDIAVIHANVGDGLFPARRGTGEELSQGDRVYAFGSPFGFKFSMSEGIVSGLGRDPTGVLGQNPGGYTNFIQTDAAVNPGNSGGPLVDVNGRVIGMNVAIATGVAPTGASEGQSAGISFAIPLDTIESVVDQLINGGAVNKGFLGIQHPGNDDMNAQALRSVGFAGTGVYLDEVTPGGPADQAGLKTGDIITDFNGRSIRTTSALRQAIAVSKPGQQVRLKAWRNGKEREFVVSLGDQSQSMVGVVNAHRAIRFYGFDVVDTKDGPLISAVAQNSEAATAGLHPGQVFLKLDDQEVKSATDLLGALAEKGFLNGRRLTAVVANEDGDKTTVELRYQP
jgi:serine protease Do